MRLRLLKIGSDPEALFYDGTKIIPATRFAGPRRLSSWIGTDGHSVTAELRPIPFRDVRLHVYNIAQALKTIRETVQKVSMIAQPFYEPSHESMGGHIHMSFRLEDLAATPAILRGRVLLDREEGSVPRALPHNSDYLHQAMTYYWQEANAGRAFTMGGLAAKLRRSVGYLETALYGPRRASRTYGTGQDEFRFEYPAHAIKPGVITWRIEYRYPSTWLHHPALALTYLGLVKLTVNNYEAVPAATVSRGSELIAWLEEFCQSAACITDDVKNLPKLVQYCLTTLLPNTSKPVVLVDFEAWEEFLNTGRWK